MTQLAEPKPIREYEGVDRRLFLDEIRPAGQPAVLRGLAAGWPAVQAALRSDEEIVAYLKHFRVERPVGAIVGPPEIGGRFFYTDDIMSLNFERGTSQLDPFLDKLLRDRDASAPLAMAVQSEKIPEMLPGFEIENAIDLLPPDVVPRAWIGNRIRVAPHYDLMENVGCVVAGRRRFTVFPPEQLANLYPGPFELTPPARRSAWSTSRTRISTASPVMRKRRRRRRARCSSRATPSTCPSTGGTASIRSSRSASSSIIGGTSLSRAWAIPMTH